MNRFLVKSFAFGIAFLLAMLVSVLSPSAYLFDSKNLPDDDKVELPKETPKVDSVLSAMVEAPSSTETLIEIFSDDKKIGRRGRNRIDIKCSSFGDERFAEIQFYSRTDYGAWIETQNFKFEKDGVTGCDPIVADFNNDGRSDFTYRSAVAARGANEVRKLFIYDNEHDKLVYITNSESYPNLAYNRQLNCVDSQAFAGITYTTFLRLEGERFVEFASVENGLERIVTVTRKNGERVVIRREAALAGNEFTRYSTFDPPRP